MRQLRPHLDEDALVDAVVRMQSDGYRLVVGYEDDRVVAAAGFRILEMLWCGKRLYVDDLVTDESERSKGHGKALLDWLRDEARRNGCVQLALDSGNWRTDAHRFYAREGMDGAATHFVQTLD